MNGAQQRLWAGAVQRSIGKVPLNEKLRIGDIARSLLLAQADVIACIELLIGEGRLDGKTLRPLGIDGTNTRARSSAGASEPLQSELHECAGADPAPGSGDNGNSDADLPPVTKVPPARGLMPTGQQLFRQMRAEGDRRGLTDIAISLAAFGTRASLAMLKRGTKAVRPGTWEKAQAWLANPAEPVKPVVSGAALAAEIDEFLSSSGMSASRFGRLAMNGSPSGLARIRRQRVVTENVAKRVRAFISNPPPEALQRKARAATRPTSKISSRRLSPAAKVPAGECTPSAGTSMPSDATEMPVSIDSGERQRIAAQRRGASVNRAREQHAAGLVDRGINPSSQNSQVAAQMRSIVTRREAEARAADPIEQAKLALRQRGRIVFCASVYNGPKGRFFVSGIVDDDGRRKLQTGADLIALANRVNPRGMRPAVVITTRKEGTAQ